jgi:toluene monooxygenase electron transfer component
MKLQINARNRAHHYHSGAGENVLYAGLNNAVDLPYECGSGTCGTCKARLISGEIKDAWPEAPGRKYLKGQDEFLMCQCEAKTDVIVEVANFVQTMEAGACVPGFLRGRIARANRLTPDVLLFDVELNQPLDFDAGQFVLVRLAGVAGFRGWSMVNYERRAKRLRFVVKRKPGGGISERLFNGSIEGADIDVFGPLGRATFYPSLGKNVLCIAGGSGIAGMMSILARAAQDGYFTQYRGDVFFGVRTLRDAFLLSELSELRTQCGANLQVTIALSDESVPDTAARDFPQLRFDQGMVHDVAGRHMQGRYQNVRAYLAGPPPSVDASIRMLLLQAKLTTDHIRYDKFS